MTREFVHAVTGRSIVVAEGSRTERLVVNDEHWTETDGTAKAKPSTQTGSKAPAKKTAAKKTAAKKAPAKKAETPPEAPAETEGADPADDPAGDSTD